MRLHFIGESHAARHFRLSATIRGFELVDIDSADLIFVSEDTPTIHGNRDLLPIKKLLEVALTYSVPVILTSQVPPGFCRAYNTLRLYHQSETLRIKDALQRAVFPEQIIIGCLEPPTAYLERWATAFDCPVIWCSYEEAEFSKIAINMTLASQVDNANRLSEAARKVGADWKTIQTILKHDKRIGPHSYLEPGRWQDSQHLLRDYVTLQEINGHLQD